jgi:hypothetical protein
MIAMQELTGKIPVGLKKNGSPKIELFFGPILQITVTY